MNKNNNNSMETVILGRVPASERKSWINIAAIQAGIMISIPCIMLGQTLATGMSLGNAVAATVIGFAVSVVLMTLIGMQSSDLGRPMSVAASSAFGKVGIRIFLTTLFSVALICWFGYQTVVCGQAFANLCSEFFVFHINITLSTVIWGVVMLVTAMYGINALGWLNNIAVPALIIVTISGTIIAINTYGLEALYAYVPEKGSEISLFQGIVMVFGAQSCGTVVTGDITRFQRSRKDTFLSTVIGVFPVSLIMIIMGYIMAVLTGESDISMILCTLGLPLLGMIVLILATWTTNTTNSYSAGIDMTMLFNAKDKYRSLMTAIAGIAGTILAVTGIMNTFMTFITVCGYAFGPVAGVMIADYWFYRKADPDKWFYKEGIDWVAVISWAAGVALTVVMSTDLAVFIGMVLSFVLYLILRKFIPEKRNIVVETATETTKETEA